MKTIPSCGYQIIEKIYSDLEINRICQFIDQKQINNQFAIRYFLKTYPKLRNTDDPRFINWRRLKDRTVVQPSLEILENIFTIRIHLDDCTKANGALRLILHSHTQGIIPIKKGIESYQAKAQICEVKKGGILIMKPLLLHASKRTENDLNRRVIHIEFSDMELPNGLTWLEAQRLIKI